MDKSFNFPVFSTLTMGRCGSNKSNSRTVATPSSRQATQSVRGISLRERKQLSSCLRKINWNLLFRHFWHVCTYVAVLAAQYRNGTELNDTQVANNL